MTHQRTRKQIPLIAIITLLLCSLTFGQSKRTPKAEEQISFGSETPIAKPVKLPKSVLAQLSEFEDSRLKQCQQSDLGLRESDISNHFAASVVNINNDGEQDLFVQAQTSCFMGAHSTTFWIFAKVEQRLFPGYDLIFSVSTDGLEILKTYTNGYRDIRATGHTAIELYSTTWKFDGQKYQPRQCTIEDLRTKKVVRVRCSTPE